MFTSHVDRFVLVCALVGTLTYFPQDAFPSPNQIRQQLVNDFMTTNPAVDIYFENDHISRVCGQAFSYGATAMDCADSFIRTHFDMLGVEVDDLVMGSSLGSDGLETVQVMYDPATGRHKFTAVYYTQVRERLPVFRSRIALLTRNEAGNPLVLAAANLKPLPR